jgi:hypothetical protein
MGATEPRGLGSESKVSWGRGEIMEELGPERVARAGETFVKSIPAEASGSVPELASEACIGIEWA